MGFTEKWFVESIGGEVNGFGGLLLYNDGDTNDDGMTNASDNGFLPFFNLGGTEDNFLGVVTPARLLFFCGDPATLGPGENFVDPSNNNSVQIPQPAGGSYVCGFVLRPGSASGFNLTEVGGVNGASLDIFDGWTLQDGAVSPLVTGFEPTD